MLTKGQKYFLTTIPNDKVAYVEPFNELSKKVAVKIIAEVEKNFQM